jgi:hypothetical protein
MIIWSGILTAMLFSINVVEKRIEITQVPFIENVRALEGIVTTSTNFTFSLTLNEEVKGFPKVINCRTNKSTPVKTGILASVKVTRRGSCKLIGVKKT